MNKLRVKINEIKQKTKDYLSFKKLITSLISFTQKFYVLSIQFDRVNHGLVNLKRFQISLIVCVLMWLATFYNLLIITSDNMWSLIDGPFLPDHYRTFKLIPLILLLLSTAIKTDILLEEFKQLKLSERSPLEIIYYLMNDLKLKHKLDQKNYNEIAFVSRFVQLNVLNYGAPICSLFLIGFFISIFSLDNGYWIFDTLFMMPFYVYSIFLLAICCCVKYLFYFYYKLLFDQITEQIKLFVSNKPIKITLRQERRLLNLIKQHHQAAIEINTMSLNSRRRTAIEFLMFSLIKIITLYLMVNSKHILIKGFAINVFGIFMIFGFGLSLIFSLQIESAHQGYKFIHSVICKQKMKLSLRMKVNDFYFNSNLVNYFLVKQFSWAINWSCNWFVLL